MKPCPLFGFHHFYVSEELKLIVISCQHFLLFFGSLKAITRAQWAD